MQPKPQVKPSREVHAGSPTLPWLQDVTKAAQHLTRLTLESSAQAALITRGDHLWAYAGQLSQGAAKELAVTVTRHWDGQKGSDLLRFVRLEATKAEHMLYATRIADEVVLALVFDAETPFSTIRSQASQLAQSLSIAPYEEETASRSQEPRPASYDAKTEFEEDDERIRKDPSPALPISCPMYRRLSPIRGKPFAENDLPGTRPSASALNQYSRESSPAVRVDDLPVTNQNFDEDRGACG
jgi:hypothetical protein